jgi:hypothetical protein
MAKKCADHLPEVAAGLADHRLKDYLQNAVDGADAGEAVETILSKLPRYRPPRKLRSVPRTPA